MEYRLEVVQVPVADVDRAKAFYAECVGFVVDHDAQVSDSVRMVQLTPPGSACSIAIGTGLSEMEPGSLSGLQLVVRDIAAAHEELAARGVDISEPRVIGREGWPGFKFAFFDDPDGNGWSSRNSHDQQPPQEPIMTTTTAISTGVDFICIPTKDFPAAFEFYGTVLGLPCSAEYDKIPGAEFETGSLTLQVIDCAAVGREFVPHAFPIALRVDDVDAARATLESRGVEFIHQMDSGVCHNAFFADPDGNVFILHHRYAPRDACA